MYENNEMNGINEFNDVFKGVGKTGVKGIVWGLIRSAMAVGAYVAIMALRHAAINAILGGFLIVVLFLLMILWIAQAVAGFVGGGMCLYSSHWWKKNVTEENNSNIQEGEWVVLD